MSGEYGCQACGGQHPVNWLITRLNPAATISVCEQDISAALVASLAEMMEVDAGWLLEHINTGVDEANRDAVELEDAESSDIAARNVGTFDPDDDEGTEPDE